MDVKTRLQAHIRNTTHRWIIAHRALYGDALDRIQVEDTADGITVRLADQSEPPADAEATLPLDDPDKRTSRRSKK